MLQFWEIIREPLSCIRVSTETSNSSNINSSNFKDMEEGRIRVAQEIWEELNLLALTMPPVEEAAVTEEE